MTRPVPRPLSHALAGLTASIAPTTPLARVQEVWEGTVGEVIAQAARPTGERGGVLTVTCSAAVWAQELTLMGTQLLEGVNSALGEDLVHELRCRTA